MLAEFGFGVLLITFLTGLFSIVAAVYGYFKKSAQWVERARRALQLTFPLVTLAALSLIVELVSGHFELQYVFSVSSREMPTYLKITALWGGQAGSLIFWSWLLSAFATAVTLRKWDRDREFLPWVVVVTAVTLTFFLSLSLFYENPFTRWWQTVSGGLVMSMFPPSGAILFVPPDGQGLNELLRHPGMVFHPPMLYTGFVAFVIPYAFAMAALITGRVDDRWIRLTRRWTLVAWLFLSIGLILGMWWAYDVLGWGGYWGWDSSEVAALLPWLVATPFLHTIIIQEKRQMFKQLNMILINFNLRDGDSRDIPDPVRIALVGACICPKHHWIPIHHFHYHYAWGFHRFTDLSLERSSFCNSLDLHLSSIQGSIIPLGGIDFWWNFHSLLLGDLLPDYF